MAKKLASKQWAAAYAHDMSGYELDLKFCTACDMKHTDEFHVDGLCVWCAYEKAVKEEGSTLPGTIEGFALREIGGVLEEGPYALP